MVPHPSTMPAAAAGPGPWTHGSVPVLGLIGGIGAGKSRVAAALADRGAVVIDADAVGHALLQREPIRGRVLARFGESILVPGDATDGGPRPIDRRALGALVFARPEALRDLEAILHPPMRRALEEAIEAALARPTTRAVVLDAAILLEAGWDALCDRVAFVEAPAPVRLERLAAQRGWDAATLAARERAQWPLEQKRRRADVVLSNDAGPDRLGAEVDRLWAGLIGPSPVAGGPALAADDPVVFPAPDVSARTQ